MLRGPSGCFRHTPAAQGFLSAKTYLGVEFLKHCLLISQQLMSLVRYRKMKAICLSWGFSFFFLHLFVSPSRCCNECKVICAWLQLLLVAMWREREWRDKIAAVDEEGGGRGRGGLDGRMSEDQRDDEGAVQKPPCFALSLSFSTS